MDVEASRERLGTDEEHAGFLMAELSNAMVRLHKDLFGRGPTKTRADYAGRDLLVISLEDSLTRIERTMADAGEHERVRDLRLHFEHVARGEFIRAVEEITGRKVRAFVSGVDPEHDIASEVFYLEPEGERAAS